MTTEELLKPRYKVIADYPNSEFEDGEILYGDDNFGVDIYTDTGKWKLHPLDYPHLFKKLEWWEERNVDMPKYLKMYGRSKIYKVLKALSSSVYVEGESFSHGWNEFEPATKEEYDNQ